MLIFSLLNAFFRPKIWKIQGGKFVSRKLNGLKTAYKQLKKLTTMKKLIYCLMAMVAVCSMTSCDKDWNDINPRKVIISDVNIECIKEVEGVHDPTSGL